MEANFGALLKARQNVNDICRKFPKSVLHFDYEMNIAKIFTDGADENIIIFGELFKTLSALAFGTQKCETSRLLERMKRRE